MQEDIFHVRLNLYGSKSWKQKMENLLITMIDQSLLKPDAEGTLSDLIAGKSDVFPIDMSRSKRLESLWQDSKGIFFSKVQPEYWINLYRRTMRPKNREPDWLNMGIEETFFESGDCTEEFIQFGTSLYLWGDMFYGYISHPADFDNQTQLSEDIIVGRKIVSNLGRDIRQMIPGIFWGNFFNSAFVDWFGREKFETLPCYKLEYLSDGGVFIQMSSSPLEYDETGGAQEAVKQHLGRNAFANIHDPYAPTISPIQDGVITIPDESKDWPQRLTDLQKKMSGDT